MAQGVPAAWAQHTTAMHHTLGSDKAGSHHACCPTCRYGCAYIPAGGINKSHMVLLLLQLLLLLLLLLDWLRAAAHLHEAQYHCIRE